MAGTAPRVDSAPAGGSQDDPLTLAALGIVAYIVCDVGHELAGHGGVCLATGGQPSSFSTTHFQCFGGWQPLITAAGILFNIALGTTLSLILSKRRGLSPHARHFLWLTMGFNLFSGWGYLVQSSVTDSGDWAAFLRLLGLAGWRWSMIPIGAAGYYWSLRIAERRFEGGDVWRLVYLPYLAAAWIPVIVRAVNSPQTLVQLVGALMGSLLFAWGFLVLPLIVRRKPRRADGCDAAPVLTREPLWLLLAASALALFIGALGPGVRLAAPQGFQISDFRFQIVFLSDCISKTLKSEL